jgi:Phosphotransferase System HPr (HPr) Family
VYTPVSHRLAPLQAASLAGCKPCLSCARDTFQTASEEVLSAGAVGLYTVKRKGCDCVQKEITIVNKLGLHARAAAKFVRLAAQFECDIRLVCGEREVNGKSMMGVMMLAASRGTRLRLITSGKDEEEAARCLEELVKRRFDEEE